MPVKSYNTNDATNTENEGAGNFGLVKDINDIGSSIPSNTKSYNNYKPFAVLDKVIYFNAEDGEHGVELWRSDGTEDGTYLVKDIFEGKGSSYPSEIIAFKNKIYFQAYSETSGVELYCSDGTKEGTYLLKDIYPGTKSSSPINFCIKKGSLYFTVSNEAINDEIWSTDGTSDKTELAVNIKNLGAQNAYHLNVANNLIFFIAYTSTSKWEIWRTDGKAAGTFMIKNVIPDGVDYIPAALTPANDKLLFAVYDSSSTITIWETNGSDEGTKPLPSDTKIKFYDLRGDIFNNYPFFILKNTLYLIGNTEQEYGLFKYDLLNDGGFILVKSIFNDYYSFSPFIKGSVDGEFYFMVYQSQNEELWKSGGSDATTVLVKNLPFKYSTPLATDNHKIYFVGVDENGSEPWISDGTEDGTHILKDINNGLASSLSSIYTNCNGKVFFRATNLNTGIELWCSGGNKANTTLVKDINVKKTHSSLNDRLITEDRGAGIFNYNTLVFTAYNAKLGSEFWKSDGTEKGTSLVKDIYPGPLPSTPNSYTFWKKYLIFKASDSNYKTSLFFSTGTGSTTEKVAEHIGYGIRNFKINNKGVIFYLLPHSPYDIEIWRTDRNKNSYLLSTDVYLYGNLGATAKYGLFTKLNNGKFELWSSNGTIDETKRIYNFTGLPADFTSIGNKSVFRTTTNGNGELWITDGTTSGTKLVSAISPTYLTNSAFSNGYLYFSATNNSNGTELYKTNGKASGTKLVKEINNGYAGSNPSNFCAVNGVVYFTAYDPVHGTELWKTEGKERNTELVKDITPGAGSSQLKYLTSAGGKLYFVFIDNTETEQLWVSEGKASNTKQVKDAGLKDVYHYGGLFGTATTLFMSAGSNQYGQELFAGDVSENAKFSIAPIAQNSLPGKNKIQNIEVTINPNPAVNEVNINIKNSKEKYVVTISDIQGKIYWSAKGNSDKNFTVNIASYLKGTYLISVNEMKNRNITKLVFQKL